jgi:hypothetical protein
MCACDALIDLVHAKQGVWGSPSPPNFGRFFLDPKSSAAGASRQCCKHDLQAAMAAGLRLRDGIRLRHEGDGLLLRRQQMACWRGTSG